VTRILDILNGFPHAVALLDSRLRVIRLNSMLETVTGYDNATVKGIASNQVLRDNIHPANLQTVLDSGQTMIREGDLIDAQRRKVPMRFTMSPLMDDSGRPVGVMLVMEDIAQLKQSVTTYIDRGLSGAMIGHSPGMQELFELLPILAHTDAAVLITGETGTGKDLLAETIHQASKRSSHPFIKVNCGAIPEALLESELFGHQRGAFTGAHTDKPGMFRLAQGGTIFLNEIGDLPLHLQVKLLTVLDDMAFYPLGSTKQVSVDVRIITGTHRNLKQLVQTGQFREDLFFRLNVLRAHLPPLRERGEDIPLLLDHFMRKIAASSGKEILGFNPAAMACLKAYPYPGNIRELRNIVEYSVSICQATTIDSRHLPSYLLTPPGKEEMPATATSLDDRIMSLPSNTHATPAPSSWSEIEKEKILRALVHNNGNRTLAARELGWGRSTLWRKINQYNLG